MRQAAWRWKFDGKGTAMLGSLMKPISTIALFIASSLIWSGIGTPLIRGLQSGEPETISGYVMAFGTLAFVSLLIGQLACAVRDVPQEAIRSLIPAEGAGPMEAARAVLGPKANARLVAAKASEISTAWSRPPAHLRFADSCRHEAAHAITAHRFGGIILGATVNADGNGQMAWARPPVALTTCNDHWMRLCVAIAGSVLDHSEGRHNNGSAMDTKQVLGDAVALLATGESPDDFGRTLGIDNIFAEARELVGELLAERADELNAIAAELAKSGRLTGYQINRVLGSSLERAESTS